MDERAARVDIEERKRDKDAALAREAHPVNLDTLYGEISTGQVRELNIILKTDVKSETAVIAPSVATDGAWSEVRGQGILTRIHGVLSVSVRSTASTTMLLASVMWAMPENA